MVELSVIIPTHNRLERLKHVLGAFERQSYALDAFEVIVISDASTDGTHEFLETYQTPLHFRFVIQEHGGPAKARNTGVAHAQGTFILFIDDDVVPTPDLISEHMRLHHTAEQHLIVLGPMLSPRGFPMAPWVRWEQAMLMKQYDAMQQGLWAPTARQFYTGNTSLRRLLVVQAGGFDEHFRRAEDVELAYRLNDLDVTYVFNAQAIGYHYADRSFRSWMDIPYAYGRNDVIFATSRGQPWILQVTRKEFGERNAITRILVRVCLGRVLLSRVVLYILQLVATLGALVRIERVPRVAFSGIFSLRYYQGMADELGDTAFLFQRIDQYAESKQTLA